MIAYFVPIHYPVSISNDKKQRKRQILISERLEPARV